ncbi:MAG: OmpH family outer membrane protein [Deltaproteobacteria bacterium]|nr:OmpH family outer membrane protein [Deltaproteobacteria bacterium]
MKKTVFWCVVTACLLFFSYTAAAQSDFKIGVVDLQKCIAESVEGKRVYNELKSKKDAMQKQVDKKQDELLKISDMLEKQSMMLSMDAKEDKAKEFERKKREFKYMYEDLTEEMRKAEAEARTRLIGELEGVVSEIGERDGYMLLFERRSSGIMHFGKVIDVTGEVVKLYDQKKRKGK